MKSSGKKNYSIKTWIGWEVLMQSRLIISIYFCTIVLFSASCAQAIDRGGPLMTSKISACLDENSRQARIEFHEGGCDGDEIRSIPLFGVLSKGKSIDQYLEKLGHLLSCQKLDGNCQISENHELFSKLSIEHAIFAETLGDGDGLVISFSAPSLGVIAIRFEANGNISVHRNQVDIGA